MFCAIFNVFIKCQQEYWMEIDSTKNIRSFSNCRLNILGSNKPCHFFPDPDVTLRKNTLLNSLCGCKILSPLSVSDTSALWLSGMGLKLLCLLCVGISVSSEAEAPSSSRHRCPPCLESRFNSLGSCCSGAAFSTRHGWIFLQILGKISSFQEECPCV